MTRALVLIGLLMIGCDSEETCPSLADPQAKPGDDIGGDTYASFASPFLKHYCVRCHSTIRTGATRQGAPLDFNWDQEASVRGHLDGIRNAVGVDNDFMPPSAPKPSCEERLRLVRWIDAQAP
jgi:hypothetical protein